jgi:uncharacterized protein YcbK (DUF882 family)
MRVAPLVTLAALFLVPAVAAAAPPAGAKHGRTARVNKIDRGEKADKADKPDKADKAEKPEAKPCVKSPVEVVAGGESATFSLARCDGSAVPVAVDQLSILARPATVAKPKMTIDVLARGRGREIAPGIRRLDPRLLERLEVAVEHFRKSGQTPKVTLISGYRPKSAGSYHQSGRALDLRIEGITNEALVAFCKTLPDTGCGYYPNSLFVHIDVRDAGAGHVAWIDTSKPGEPPKYVTAWPPAAGDDPAKLPALPADDQALSRQDQAVSRQDLSRQEEKSRKLDRHPYFF